MKLCVFALALFVSGAVADAANARHAAGIAISTGKHAEVKRSGTASWLNLNAGVLLFPGDSARAGDGELRYALCPALSIQTLPANQMLTLLEPPDGGKCSLPDTVPTDAIPVRRGMDAAIPKCSAVAVDLPESLRAAARAVEVRDYKNAVAEYRQIGCSYPGAAWTRGVISRVAEIASEREGRGSKGPGETYALLIGISTYPAETPQLQFADADARAFKDFLQQPKGGSVPESHIRLLTNETATRAAIDDAIDEFVKNARKPENTLIVFIAGHGDYLTVRKDPDTGIEIREDPFLVTYDAYVQDVKSTGFPMSKIRDFIADQAQGFLRVIAYVDVCHAGYTAQIGGVAVAGLPAAVKRVFLANQGSVGLLMATKPGPKEYAYESPTFGGGHGAFTYSVLRYLIDAAASPGHKEVSLANLYAGANTSVVRLTNGAQTPDQFSTNPQMSVLDDASLKVDFSIGDAAPLPEAATRRGRGRTTGQTPARSTAPATAPAGDRVALEDHGQEILVRYLRGEQNAMVKADFEHCADYFRAALEIVPLNAFDESRMLFCQGRAAIFDKAYSRAIALLQQSIQLDPERSYAYNALGIAYLEQTRTDTNYYGRAVDAFQDAMRFAPNWAYPLHNLALAYAERGDFFAASRSYLRAMELAKYYSYLPYNLGLLNQSVNRLDEAEKCYRQAIAVAKYARLNGIASTTGRWRERAIALNALASVDMARGRYRSALSNVRRALQDDDSLAAAKYNEAVILSRSGPSPDAERLWREIVAVDPFAFASRLALAQYLDRTGKTEEALAESKELLRVSAGDVEGHRLAGTILLRLKRPEEALQHLDFVKSRATGDPAAFEAWADAATLMNRAGAAEGYRRALRLCTAARDKRRLRKKLAAVHY